MNERKKRRNLSKNKLTDAQRLEKAQDAYADLMGEVARLKGEVLKLTTANDALRGEASGLRARVPPKNALSLHLIPPFTPAEFTIDGELWRLAPVPAEEPKRPWWAIWNFGGSGG